LIENIKKTDAPLFAIVLLKNKKTEKGHPFWMPFLAKIISQ